MNNMDFVTKLKTDGYIIIRNKLTPNELSQGLASIYEKGIDYTQMKKFIDYIYLPKVNDILGWNSIYLKFRFSNFENLKDASLFHNDLYNHSDDNIMPVYTGLCYFDDSSLEIIPQSHIKSDLTLNEMYEKKKVINVYKGDILIFHANLFHRGIAKTQSYHKDIVKTDLLYMDNGETNRRVLQIFEIFPNEITYNKLNDKIIAVLTTENNLANSGLLPIKSNVNKYIVYLHYLLVGNDMQYKIIGSDISDAQKKNKYVGYEPGGRSKIIPGKHQPLNINIIVKDHNTLTPNRNKQKIIFCLIFIILIYLIIKLFKY